MIHLIIGLLCLFAFAMLTIVAASKVQRNKREEKKGKGPTEKTDWLQTPAGKNLKTAAILTVIYFTAIWLCYNFGAKWMQSAWGFTQRTSWVLVTLLGIGITVPAIWLLYSAANIPGDPKAVKKGMRTIAFAILAFFAYTYYAQPVEFFNSQSGKPVAQIDPATNKLYYFPQGDSMRYSPETGERLRQVTKEDVKRLNLVPKQSPGNLLEKAEATVKRWNTPRVDTVIFTKSQWPQSGPVIYEIQPGTGWTPPILYTGRLSPPYRFLTKEVSTFVCAYVDGTYNPSTRIYTNGSWNKPLPDGPDHWITSEYFRGTTKLCWERRPYTYFVLIDWRR